MIACVAICLLAAPCLAQSSGMIGPELRQWVENPAQGLEALREGRIADCPKPPEAKAKAAPVAPAPTVSDKAVEITFVDPGMEVAVRNYLGRPTGPITDEDCLYIGYIHADGLGIQTLVDLQYMPNLYELSLSKNGLTSLSDLPPLYNLRRLDISNNRITSLAILIITPWLEYLNANENQITTLTGMPFLRDLGYLLLNGNRISSLEGMPQLPQLWKLDLGRNDLSTLAGITPTDNLCYFNLSRNHLSSLNGMPRYDRIYTLDISHNQLETAAGLYLTAPVEYLYASHNRFASPGILGQLDHVRELDLSANELTNLDGASYSNDMMRLDLSGNHLSSLEGIGNYPLISKLNASRNCLKSLGALAGTEGLTSLYLAGNGLTSLADIPAMPELVSLDVSCNQLTTLAGMGDTPMLQNLEARFNQLQSLDPGFRGALGYFGFSSNGLTSLDTLSGASTPSVYMIDASFNNLGSLRGVEHLQLLTSIAARGNQLASLADLGQNPLLNWLDVSSNQLASFDDLPPNPPLAWLNASRNQIASLSGLAAAANLYLTRLDVSKNLLTSVAEIARADRLYSLDIADNQVSDITPLQGRRWTEIGLANNPTGDVQSVIFGSGGPESFGARVVSVGPGQLPSLAPFGPQSHKYAVINATGPEYSDPDALGLVYLKQLSVCSAGIASLDAFAATRRMYGGQISQLSFADNALTDLSPLVTTREGVEKLDVSGNQISDITPVTRGYGRNDSWYESPIGHLNVSSNPVGSLEPALGLGHYHISYPPIGAIIFMEYDLEMFGMTPEQAHNCVTWQPVVNVTDTPVANAPEVAQLRADGVKVSTDGTYSYCEGACVPPLQVSVPDLTGAVQEDASATLAAAGLTTGTVARQCSDAVAAGSVISQNPAAGATVDAGSSVALLVSLGPCTVPVTVPDVVGQSPSDAVAVIQAAGLLVGSLSQQHSGTIPAGAVAEQNPAAGAAVPPGTAVALVISLGPDSSGGEGEGEPLPTLHEQAQALYDGFDAADTNGDKRLSLAEAQAAQPGLTADGFAELDRNSDGALSRRELDAYLEHDGNGCCGCHGGHSGWGQHLGDLFVLFLGLMGLAALGSAVRP